MQPSRSFVWRLESPCWTPKHATHSIFDPTHRVMETPRTMQKRGTTTAKLISQTRETDGSNGDKVTFLSRVCRISALTTEDHTTRMVYQTPAFRKTVKTIRTSTTSVGK